MKRKTMLLPVSIMFAIFCGCSVSNSAEEQKWAIHDMNRPVSKVVNPLPVPSDAIVLFDGKDLSKWVSDKDGSSPKWKIENGYAEAVKKAGGIRTKQAFGDCQLHIEWATPKEVVGPSQGRGNSGVFLMGLYELQVLDCYNNRTYADGMAGSIYGQNPPLVNVCLPPGQWQSYDIIFHHPIFKDGKLAKPATITVLQNGVLVQDNFAIKGPTAHIKETPYAPHADKLPIMLQEHGNPIRYRNIWIREL